jgi:hypothetical protein
MGKHRQTVRARREKLQAQYEEYVSIRAAYGHDSMSFAEWMVSQFRIREREGQQPSQHERGEQTLDQLVQRSIANRLRA